MIKAKIDEIVFGPEQSIEKFVIDNINDAKKKIKMMVFWFTWKPIARSLIKAANRGLEVSVILDSRSSEIKQKDVNLENEILVPKLLKENNIDTRIYSGELLHHKIILIDDDVVLTGTCNFFNASLNRHEEHYMKITSKGLHNQFLQRYYFLKDNSQNWSSQ